MVARTLAFDVIADCKNHFQNFKFFSIKILTNKVFESISKRPYPLKIILIILENSAALSPCKILMKRSIVRLVIQSVSVCVDQVCEAKQTCGNLLRREAPPMSVELLIELL